MFSKVRIGLPGTRSVHVGQCIARNRLAATPHVVHPSGWGAQIDFDVAQGFAIGQLADRHGKELIQTRKVFGLVTPPNSPIN
jgi:hypothetical protein